MFLFKPTLTQSFPSGEFLLTDTGLLPSIALQSKPNLIHGCSTLLQSRSQGSETTEVGLSLFHTALRWLKAHNTNFGQTFRESLASKLENVSSPQKETYKAISSSGHYHLQRSESQEGRVKRSLVSCSID